MSLEFACKVFKVDEVLRCSFGLNKTEYLILRKLLTKELSANQLSKFIKKDQSTIQRSLKKLLAKKLVKRRQVNLSKGGYEFLYKTISKEVIKNQMREMFDNFKKLVTNTINEW